MTTIVNYFLNGEGYLCAMCGNPLDACFISIIKGANELYLRLLIVSLLIASEELGYTAKLRNNESTNHCVSDVDRCARELGELRIDFVGDSRLRQVYEQLATVVSGERVVTGKAHSDLQSNSNQSATFVVCTVLLVCL